MFCKKGPHLVQGLVPGEDLIMYTRLMEELNHVGRFATLAIIPTTDKSFNCGGLGSFPVLFRWTAVKESIFCIFPDHLVFRCPLSACQFNTFTRLRVLVQRDHSTKHHAKRPSPDTEG